MQARVTASLPASNEPLDVFNMQFFHNANPADASMQKESTETEDNYMELHVQKELKEKIEPLTEQLVKRKEEHEKQVEKVKELEKSLSLVSAHFNGVARALLSKQGIVLNEINEYSILKEFARIAEKENIAKKKMKM